jgi:hypothetical protein
MKLQNVNNNNYPFNYYTFDNFFNSDEINQLKKIELNNNSSVLTGERISNNNRYYLTVENIKNSNVLEEIVKYFLDSNVINFFENKHNLTLKDSYLRVELVGDKKGSFLEPHTDIEEKIISLLIYLNDTNEDEIIGTSLYDNDQNYIKTVPYKDNTGFYFLPGKDTWHGLESVNVKEIRKVIMVNYCTFKTDFKV